MIFFFGADFLIVIAVIIFLVVALFTVGLTGMCNWALDNPAELALKIFVILFVIAVLTALIASDNHKYGIKHFLHCLFIGVPASAGITAGLMYCIYLISGYVTASEWDALAIFMFIVPMLQIFFIIVLCVIALGLGALIGVFPAIIVDETADSLTASFFLSILASLIPSGVIALFVHFINSGFYKIFFLVTY